MVSSVASRVAASQRTVVSGFLKESTSGSNLTETSGTEELGRNKWKYIRIYFLKKGVFRILYQNMTNITVKD